MALPYSSYFYCEGFFDERMGSWLTGHMHGFEFFGGVPVVLVPDNCKTAVTEGRRRFYEEVVLNRKYSDFADYYGIAIRPARIRHPKDKSVCERSVRIIEDDIMPEMEKLDIYSLDEFNSILRKKLARRLARPFTKRYGSRTSIFEEEEKKTLLPLPVAGYHSYTEREAAVGRPRYSRRKRRRRCSRSLLQDTTHTPRGKQPLDVTGTYSTHAPSTVYRRST